jgi:AcrR family transcriptional regulator
MAHAVVGRRGRPPASRAGETRQRIISVATELFSDLGYGNTTNRHVALRADISTGALYYYFPSKLDMYMAVFREQQAVIDDRMKRVMNEEHTFRDRLSGILHAAHELNLEYPYLARFQSTARIDRQRHAELQRIIPHPPGEGAGLMGRLISEGMETHEIQPGREWQVEIVVRLIFVGLVDSASADASVHRLAIEGLESLIDGTLLRRPEPVPTRAGSARPARVSRPGQ